MITFKDVTYQYPGQKTELFNNFSITFTAQKTTVILGPNGCGKSTLFHLAYGWLSPQKGQISIFDKPLNQYSRPELGQHLAVLPQFEKAPFQLSVMDYVLLGRTPYLKLLARPSMNDYLIAKKVVGILGIEQLANKQISQLSGGEQQLAFIARALTQQTPLLLLDEVNTHLDLEHIKTIFTLIKKMSFEGKAIIITLHDPTLAYAIADEIVLMSPDRQYIQGPPADIMTKENLSMVFQTNIPVMENKSHFAIDWDGFLKIKN